MCVCVRVCVCVCVCAWVCVFVCNRCRVIMKEGRGIKERKEECVKSDIEVVREKERKEGRKKERKKV